MSTKKLPSVCRIKELLEYNAETGKITWRVRRNQYALAGSEAGCISDCRGKSYLRIRVDDVMIMAHWVAWAIYHGEWLTTGIDHIDGNGLNNIITNLRSAPQSINNKNAAIRKDNKTGVSGVTTRGSRFIPNIRVDGKQIWLGSFSTLREAAKVRRDALLSHGFHENHGRLSQTNERK